MDQELLDLLGRLSNSENPLTDEELARIDEQIVGIAADIAVSMAAGQVTDDDVNVLTEAREFASQVRTEQLARQTAAEERHAAAMALVAEIVPPETEPEVEVPVDETPADTDTEVADEETDAPVGEEPVTVAAAGTPPAPVAPVATAVVPAAPRPALPRISHLAARSPARTRPARTATRHSNGPTLIASADLPGLSAGNPVDAETWARAAMRRYDAISRMDDGRSDGERVYFGSIKIEYPEDRYLDDNEDSNQEKIEAVVNPQALAASGGICAPVAADYGLSTIAQADRPVKAALANFGATRGGIRYVLPHTLSQVTADAPASVWTQANDISLNSPATKPHATFTCQGVHEDYVDAVTSIVQFGNFQARYFPEQIQQYLDTVDAVHARLADATLLQAMSSGSTAVTHDIGELGATRELLATVDLAAAAYRYRHRMADDAPLRFIYPEWLEDMLRTDLARQLPGDSGSGAERLAVADAEIMNFFAVRRINVSTTYDSPTGATVLQGWGTQNPGQLNPWPLKTICWLFHEGAWMVIDGGEMNLGMVRDSTLNRTNDYQMFSETFEKAIFRGHESIMLTMTISPSGASAGTVSTTPYYLGGS